MIQPTARDHQRKTPVIAADRTMKPDTQDDRSSASPTTSNDAPPMSMSMLARLFGVPLLIVTLVIGSAVLVVLLFGSIAAEQERSVAQLLSVLDRQPVGKVFDVALMPQDKEIWQAAKELAARLQRKDVELTAAEMTEVVTRLSQMVDRELQRSGPVSPERLEPLHFFIAALGATGQPESVEPLLRCTTAPDWQTRREALKALGQAAATPGVRENVERIALALDDENPTVRTVAAFVLTFIADPDDRAVLGRLRRACEDAGEDREVRWNAALTVARLGSPESRGLLLDMLDRRYWQERTKVRLDPTDAGIAEQPMPPGQVESILCATVEAAGHVPDPAVISAIEALADDESLQVREAVRVALARPRSQDPGGS